MGLAYLPYTVRQVKAAVAIVAQQCHVCKPSIPAITAIYQSASLDWLACELSGLWLRGVLHTEGCRGIAKDLRHAPIARFSVFWVVPGGLFVCSRSPKNARYWRMSRIFCNSIANTVATLALT